MFDLQRLSLSYLMLQLLAHFDLITMYLSHSSIALTSCRKKLWIPFQLLFILFDYSTLTKRFVLPGLKQANTVAALGQQIRVFKLIPRSVAKSVFLSIVSTFLILTVRGTNMLTIVLAILLY